MHRVSAFGTGWVPADDKRAPRGPVDLSVVVTRGDEPPHQGRLTSLSASGAGLALDSACPVGATMQLEFRLPTSGTIRCSALVRHSRPGRAVGVIFLNLNPGAEAEIDAYLEGLW